MGNAIPAALRCKTSRHAKLLPEEVALCVCRWCGKPIDEKSYLMLHTKDREDDLDEFHFECNDCDAPSIPDELKGTGNYRSGDRAVHLTWVKGDSPTWGSESVHDANAHFLQKNWFTSRMEFGIALAHVFLNQQKSRATKSAPAGLRGPGQILEAQISKMIADGITATERKRRVRDFVSDLLKVSQESPTL